ncbi:MAG: hypothetical protein WA474_23200, partial [Candidatus Sulfotelmatobacter sp.]
SGDAERDSVAIAEFLFAIEQELDERAVDVAEAEEAEVVGADGGSPRMMKNTSARNRRYSRGPIPPGRRTAEGGCPHTI